MEKDLIRRLFREELMREFVIYQDILEQGMQRGLQRGEAIALLGILTQLPQSPVPIPQSLSL